MKNKVDLKKIDEAIEPEKVMNGFIKWFDKDKRLAEMKTSDVIGEPTVNIVFTRLIGILSKEEMRKEIELIKDDLFALEHELEYGHLFDALPKESEEEGAF